jgi:lipoprotein NlpD
LIRLLGILLLAALLTLPGCRSWFPGDDGGRVYKTSYELTPDGYYRVRKGDTLHAIAFNFGMDWRDIAAWNNIRSPYTIYPDQKLRLTAPAGSASRAVTKASGKSSAPPPKTTPATKSRPPPAASPGDPTRWLWPTEGRLISRFRANDPTRNGIEIGGKDGQAVRATAAGQVVYSGNGLIGYGELIIIKHSERMLSAYGHNRKRLVSEGQRVAAGDRIAEMGRDERNQTLLHFEIRRNGAPQDPMGYLPAR